MAGNSSRSAPAPDQVEVTIFGPGYGECIVIHAGHGDCAVLDSCLDQQTGEPAALQYLPSIDVDVAAQLKAIVATHWDDDHVRGISRLLAAAPRAKFSCPSAMTSAEFRSVLAAWRLIEFIPGGSGVTEIDAVMSELARRSREGIPPSRRNSCRPVRNCGSCLRIPCKS